ncbi:aminotransferase class I/II-fold pyridoxal phosphate-dependent enzyme [Roseiterribacter gracilis]|uniref:Transcriptional regulator n=1 Tax=Roseiterribacter gracilis TaxID=2812848 RepID=A0A8S8XF64_9PROT|nr:transcriptional regulator [Rhodospirillales bacterium TMPK1]
MIRTANPVRTAESDMRPHASQVPAAARGGLLRATESVVAERIERVGLDSEPRSGWSSASSFETDNSLLIANALTGLTRGAPLPQIARAFRGAILNGLVAPGAKMPAEATLADILGIAPRRAAAAYAKLCDEGLLVRDGRSWRVPLALAANEAARESSGDGIGRGEFARRVVAALEHSTPPSSLGLPLTPDDGPLDLFPLATWMRLHDRIAKLTGQSVLRAADYAGFRPLREVIADYARRTFGIDATADRTIIVRGPHRALSLVASALLEIGNEAWIETPGEPSHLAALAAAQARAVGVPGDDKGIVVADGEARAPAAKLAIVRPLDGARGSVMSPERWNALTTWSEQMRSWIIADHTRSEIRVARDAGDPAYNGNRVVQVGGFDGLMFPSLGCAWIIAPDSLVDPLLAMLRLWDEPVPMPTQATLAEYMGSPMHGLHLDRALAERSARLAAFQTGFDLGGGRPEQLLVPHSQGLRVMIPGIAQDRAVADACRAAGVGVQAISTRAAIGHETGLVAGFAGTPAKRTEAAAIKLARTLRQAD